jgi:charged multivesicular body protein 2A
MFWIFHFLICFLLCVHQAMVSLNKQINLPELQATMAEFQKQSEVMGMKQEMMEDAMDELMDDDETEEEQERIVQSVFDEIGIQLNEDLVSAPSAGSKVRYLV